MGDFHGDRECVTHHACDCIQAERDRYREALERIAAVDPDHPLFDVGWFIEVARDALSPSTGGGK